MPPVESTVAEASGLAAPLAWTAALSSVGSLAHTLQAKRRPTTPQIVGAVLNSSVNGIIAYFVLAGRLGGDPQLHVAVAALAGVGQANVVDFIVTAVRAKLAQGDHS